MSLSRNQLIEWLKTIDVAGKTVLDVGAGPKDKWAINWVKGKPKEYWTADIQNFDGIEYTNFDLNEPKVGFSMFEIVFCLETLEHVWNPIMAIHNLAELTEEICYISTPFINPHHDRWDYLRFTGEWFEKVLREVGFKEVIAKERVATRGLKALKEFYELEGMRVSKIRPERNRYTHSVGYMVEARK